jgi:alpha-tubulin suppressor-like RCC1 family protein
MNKGIEFIDIIGVIIIFCIFPICIIGYLIYKRKYDVTTRVARTTTIQPTTTAKATTIQPTTTQVTTIQPTTTQITTIQPTTTQVTTTASATIIIQPINIPLYNSNKTIFISKTAYIIKNGELYVSGEKQPSNNFIKIPTTSTFTNSEFNFIEGSVYLTSNPSYFDNSTFYAMKNNGDVYYGHYTSGSLKMEKQFSDNTLLNNNIRQISYDGKHTCVVTKNNEVYVKGDQFNGTLGNGFVWDYQDTYEKIVSKNDSIQHDISAPTDPMPSISMSACTIFNTILLTTTGKLYSAGEGQLGILGLGTNTGNVSLFTLVPFDKTVKILYAKNNSVTVITTENKLYACGSNDYAQFGGMPGNIFSYKLIPNSNTFTNEDIKMATHGLDHLLILKNDGTLYSCGSNGYGQLGLSLANNMNTFKVTLIPTNGPVDFIGCGKNSSGYYKNGQLYTFGENTNGQLGLGHNNNVNVPTLVSFT